MAFSRYRNTGQLNVSETGSLYYETVEYPTVKQLENIPSYKIRVSDFERLDILAFKYLGSGEYWWIIALMNDLEWPYSFEQGAIFRIPVNIEDVLKLF